MAVVMTLGESPDAAGASTCVARVAAVAVAATLLAVALFPAAALAHGPVAPVASSYLAKITRVPEGLTAKVIDADQSMWLQVRPSATTVVLDYRGAPYLRFSGSGVAVNEESEMYYLNQNPSVSPPGGLTRTTPPKWQAVTDAHAFTWRDGRLGALATVVVPPGTTDVGAWRIPLRVAGALTAISGDLLYAPNPSIVWFWPILVVILCVLAAWRVRRPTLDRTVGRVLAVAALVAIAVGGVGRGLYGRPTVSSGQLVFVAVLLAFVTSLLIWVHRADAGWFSLLLVSIAALWEDLEVFPVLLHGYVLMVVPAFVGRAAAVTCIACTAGLFPLSLRLGDRTPDAPPWRQPRAAVELADGDVDTVSA